MKTDRQVHLAGGFKSPEKKDLPRQRVNWKIWLMFTLIAILVGFTPYIATNFVRG